VVIVLENDPQRLTGTILVVDDEQGSLAPRWRGGLCWRRQEIQWLQSGHGHPLMWSIGRQLLRIRRVDH